MILYHLGECGSISGEIRKTRNNSGNIKDKGHLGTLSGEIKESSGANCKQESREMFEKFTNISGRRPPVKPPNGARLIICLQFIFMLVGRRRSS